MHRYFVRCNCPEIALNGNCTEYTGPRSSRGDEALSLAIKDAKFLIAEGHSNVTLSAEILMATQKEIVKI